MKAKLSIFAGLAVSGILVYFAFRDIDLKNLISLYSSVSAVYLLFSGCAVLFETYMRALRWRLLLLPLGRAGIWSVFKLETIGLALNNLLPLRLGELVRGTLGGTILNLPIMTVFSTILVERALDLITLFIIFLAAVMLDRTGWDFRGFGVYFWIMLGFFAAVMVVLIFMDEFLSHKNVSNLFLKFPRSEKVLRKIALGIRGFRGFKSSAGIIAAGFALWLLDALNYYIFIRAFGLHNVVGYLKSIKLLFAGALSVSIPSMPGYFGNFEFSLAKALGIWGVPQAQGLAYASLMHLTAYVLVTVIGLVFIYQAGHSIGSLWKQFKDKI
ncbi:MAG: flippase-like domain-containing protein [Elusimicrobia bacterium]|nr:flippase-like domain-containing protein [Elusimicrobiota bacterium]